MDLAFSKSMFEIPTLIEIRSQLTQIGHPCRKMFKNYTRQCFTHLCQFKYPTTIFNAPCIQHLCQNLYIGLQGPRRQTQAGSQAPKRHTWLRQTWWQTFFSNIALAVLMLHRHKTNDLEGTGKHSHGLYISGSCNRYLINRSNWSCTFSSSTTTSSSSTASSTWDAFQPHVESISDLLGSGRWLEWDCYGRTFRIDCKQDTLCLHWDFRVYSYKESPSTLGKADFTEVRSDSRL